MEGMNGRSKVMDVSRHEPRPPFCQQPFIATHTAEVPCAFGAMMDSSPMTTGGPNRFPVMIKLWIVVKKVMVSFFVLFVF